ncbi:hypothetical protein BG011_001761, partial [Mortierella polycephala]
SSSNPRQGQTPRRAATPSQRSSLWSRPDRRRSSTQEEYDILKKLPEQVKFHDGKKFPAGRKKGRYADDWVRMFISWFRGKAGVKPSHNDLTNDLSTPTTATSIDVLPPPRGYDHAVQPKLSHLRISYHSLGCPRVGRSRLAGIDRRGGNYCRWKAGQAANALFLTTTAAVSEPPRGVSHYASHIEHDYTLYDDWLLTAKAEGSWINGKESFVRRDENVEAEYETDDEDQATGDAMQLHVVETDGPEFYTSPIRHVVERDINTDPDPSVQK